MEIFVLSQGVIVRSELDLAQMIRIISKHYISEEFGAICVVLAADTQIIRNGIIFMHYLRNSVENAWFEGMDDSYKRKFAKQIIENYMTKHVYKRNLVKIIEFTQPKHI